MKILKYISLATFVLLFNCCKKSGNSYVKGTVFELGTGLTVSGVTVYIMYSRHPNSEPWKTLTSTVTDSNGNYHIDYNPKNRCSHWVLVQNDDNYTCDISSSKELDRKKNAVSLAVFPKAYLKLRIIKTSSTTNYMNAEIMSAHKNIKLDGIYSENPYDTLLPQTFRVCGNSDTWVRWGVGTNQTDKIYISKQDTATFTITYD